jgi:hypothetical protein
MRTAKHLSLATFALTISLLPAGADDLATREASWLSEFQRTGEPMALGHLAMVREERGKWQEAAASWHLLGKKWGTKRRAATSSAPTSTWKALADFHLQRLARKRNLVARPPQMTSALRRRVANAAIQFGDSPPADQLDILVQADLDGDLIDELVFVGSSGPLGKRTRKIMGIARWNGRQYREIWRTTKAIPFMVHVVDEDADGWKEVFCGYTPDSDDAAKLFFNGTSVVFW